MRKSSRLQELGIGIVSSTITNMRVLQIMKYQRKVNRRTQKQNEDFHGVSVATMDMAVSVSSNDLVGWMMIETLPKIIA